MAHSDGVLISAEDKKKKEDDKLKEALPSEATKAFASAEPQKRPLNWRPILFVSKTTRKSGLPLSA